MVKEKVRQAGSLAKLGDVLGVRPQTIGLILSGDNGISEKIARKLGFKRRVVYEQVESAGVTRQ